MNQPPNEAPPPRPPLFEVAILGAIGTASIFVTLGIASQLFNIGFGLWFSEVFVFFAVPYLCLRLAGYDAFRTTGLSRPWAAGALFGLVVGTVNFFAVVVPIQYVSQKLAPKELQEVFDISGIFKHQSPLDLAAVILGVCLAAPVGEELCFRGLIQRGLASRLGNTRALVLTAVAFSAFHLDPIGFTARCELGLLFGLLALRSGSLWPGIFAHLANNAVSTGLYFFSRGSEAPGEDLTAWVPLGFAAAGIPLMLMLKGVADRWPAALTAPWRAEETAKRPDLRTLWLWILAAVVCLALLFATDLNGVRLNVFDALHPLREPMKPDSQALKDWDALWELRALARDDSKQIDTYQAARRTAIAQRSGADAGTPDSGR